ncbi:hypothetical protein EV121DRAFT_292841 [Schizophyllum commune]
MVRLLHREQLTRAAPHRVRRPQRRFGGYGAPEVSGGSDRRLGNSRHAQASDAHRARASRIVADDAPDVRGASEEGPGSGDDSPATRRPANWTATAATMAVRQSPTTRKPATRIERAHRASSPTMLPTSAAHPRRWSTARPARAHTFTLAPPRRTALDSSNKAHRRQPRGPHATTIFQALSDTRNPLVIKVGQAEPLPSDSGLSTDVKTEHHQGLPSSPLTQTRRQSFPAQYSRLQSRSSPSRSRV